MISRRGEEKLDELRDELLKLARYVQTMYSKSKMAFLERNEHHARDVMYSSSILDTFQLSIERKTVILGGTLMLTGKNLRLVMMGMKLVNELTRIGKQCLTISRYSLELSKLSSIGFYNSMSKTANLIDEMFNNAVKNIYSPSTSMSGQICSKNNTVSTLLDSTEKEITETIVQNPTIALKGVKLICLLRGFREIAASSLSLTECSIFIETGEYYRCMGSEFFKFESLKK